MSEVFLKATHPNQIEGEYVNGYTIFSSLSQVFVGSANCKVNPSDISEVAKNLELVFTGALSNYSFVATEGSYDYRIKVELTRVI
ncbi:MAG: hypothetical protein FWF44_05155 [Defluviitaleaceae bacterium]|nr:hypothetical protein [Defluviitaleaceae bacterium]